MKRQSAPKLHSSTNITHIPSIVHKFRIQKRNNFYKTKYFAHFLKFVLPKLEEKAFFKYYKLLLSYIQNCHESE